MPKFNDKQYLTDRTYIKGRPSQAYILPKWEDIGSENNLDYYAEVLYNIFSVIFYFFDCVKIKKIKNRKGKT